MKNHKKILMIVILFALAVVIAAMAWFYMNKIKAEPVIAFSLNSQTVQASLWQYQCVDTVKFSRDTARGWKGRQAELEALINNQMAAIKSLGANCVSLGTPYDEEFVPFLKLWVNKARENDLAVWFRGNFSGWEGWFNYPKMASAQQHVQKTYAFITSHPEIFQDGDIFTPAPEPENGILGNPFASPQNKAALLDFLPKSFSSCRDAFKTIGKNISCGYFSVNGSVAKEILSKSVVDKIGSVVVIDHYVSDPKQMSLDIGYLNNLYQSKIAIGEFGAPISDINGPMDENQQAQFIKGLMDVFYNHKNLIPAVNYWTLQGGLTALLRDDGSFKPAVDAIKNYFKPAVIQGQVKDEFGSKISGVTVRIEGGSYFATTDANGNYYLLVPAGEMALVFEKNGFGSMRYKTEFNQDASYTANATLVSPWPKFWQK